MVEHVSFSGRFSPGFHFWAVKVKLLRSNSKPVPGANHGCKYERLFLTRVSDGKGSRALRLCFSQN